MLATPCPKRRSSQQTASASAAPSATTRCRFTTFRPGFSEIMRDADLVVAVAQRSREARLSGEAHQRHAELVAVLLEDLGMDNVPTEGHFAYVRGKLASYRVHLGSAAIRLEPGNYVCIVPNRCGKTYESLFMPFADQGDAKTSEVISKILLPANDAQIRIRRSCARSALRHAGVLVDPCA